MAAPRLDLFKEVIAMAFDTVRSNKMRSGLTVLGVVIGITSIVGMTAMIRGFDQSLRDLIAQSGPDIVYLQKFGITSEERMISRNSTGMPFQISMKRCISRSSQPPK